MTPYYDHGGGTIYHADCREVLPSLTADVVLTDLPYAVGIDYGDTLHRRPCQPRRPHQRSATNRSPHLGNPVVALTCGIGNLWRYPSPTWVLCWYQANAVASTGRWGFNQWQPVLVYGTDPYFCTASLVGVPMW